MFRTLLALLALLGATGCNFLQLKSSPEPFYSVVLQQNPSNRAALHAQGMAYQRQGRYKEALPFFERLTKLDPRDASAWYGLGRSRFELRQFAKARQDFERAHALQPSEATLLGLAAAALMDGDQARARALAAESEQTHGASAALLQLKGDIAFIAGDFTAARDFYEQSLEKNPNQPSVREHFRDLQDFLTSAG